MRGLSDGSCYGDGRNRSASVGTFLAIDRP
jgi:hypothetical protein